MVRTLIFVCTLSWISFGFEVLADEPLKQIESGENVAKTQCMRCHVVDNENLFAGISSTPSFALFVNELDDWGERFRSFHTRLPHPSIVRFQGDEPNPETAQLYEPVIIKFSDIDDLVAYVRSLKKKK